MTSGVGFGPRHLEAVLPLQGLIEGLDPQQVLTRDMLVIGDFFERDDATRFVEHIGPELSAELKRLLQEPGVTKKEIGHMLASALQ